MPFVRWTPPFLARFQRGVTIGNQGGHWLWTAALDNAGYGMLNVGLGKIDRVHRISYRLYKGEIPPGLVIDHICRVRNCVNPRHLRAVTNYENIMAPGSGMVERMALAAARREEAARNRKPRVPRRIGRPFGHTLILAAKTHCVKGHEFTPENTYRRKDSGKGRRNCRACADARWRAYRATHGRRMHQPKDEPEQMELAKVSER
jgi:hypothetical protein